MVSQLKHFLLSAAMTHYCSYLLQFTYHIGAKPIGRVVLDLSLHKIESPENKRLLTKLIENWVRLVPELVSSNSVVFIYSILL